MLTDQDKARIRELVDGLVAPASGFEKHFLRAARGEAWPISAEEREWLEYCNPKLAEPPPPAPRAARKTKPRKPIPVFDLAVVAAAVGHGIHSVEQVAHDPLLARAIELTTNRPISAFQDNPEALQGAINTAKGRYFELLVEEKLKAGESLADLELKPGQHFQLAESMTQPGWDGVVLDENGVVLKAVQIKATDNVAYLKDTLERYPDIQILATSEAASSMTGDGLVLDAGVRDADLERIVGQAFEAPTVGDTFLDAFSPIAPLTLIAASEGYRVKVGKQSISAALEAGLQRGKNSLTGTVVGAASVALGLGWFSVIPAMWAAAQGPERLVEKSASASTRIGRTLQEHYKNFKRGYDEALPRELARQAVRTKIRQDAASAQRAELERKAENDPALRLAMKLMADPSLTIEELLKDPKNIANSKPKGAPPA